MNSATARCASARVAKAAYTDEVIRNRSGASGGATALLQYGCTGAVQVRQHELREVRPKLRLVHETRSLGALDEPRAPVRASDTAEPGAA